MFRLWSRVGTVGPGVGEAAVDLKAEVEQELRDARQQRQTLRDLLLHLQQRGDSERPLVRELHVLYLQLDREIEVTTRALAEWVERSRPAGRRVQGTGVLGRSPEEDA